jgi:hypothetical protein
VFKQLYFSGWHHPGFAFIGALPFIVLFASKQRFLLGFLALFMFEILADALFTGTLNPARGLGWDQPIAIAFVILGDFRFFLLVEWVLAHGRDKNAVGLGSPKVWGAALAFAFVVPVLSTIPQKLSPGTFSGDDPLVLNRIFLLYEALFFALALVLQTFVLPKRSKALADAGESELVSWLEKLVLFELVQYGLWCIADIAILATRADGAYLLRMVPNTLYYVLFVPFAWWSAPRKIRSRSVGRVGS